ncbi:rod shape-determining protein MreD [Rhodoferax sp.]|uniref:rod shape-determining protein MreD n=1 Tax=Rhodoferax sp. TaxID=50421 RepID=UPI002611EA90|nr:rod shape-determining protein MreD [Rhodoferax sp.]MDD2809121.1 rod shape-determining protein MreD [Rhodoferax sp.]MDD5480623.1 rod shape-determining protein MreD [Rhodoferax sp.]
MIMPRGHQQLLLPAHPGFIWSSLALAFAMNMLVNMGLFGRASGVPDVLALVLAFWVIHQPQRIGVGIAFTLGLAMDVHQSSLLGQHALTYTALSFLALGIHRRLLWFGALAQMAQLLPLFVAAHALSLLVNLLAGGEFPGAWLLLAPLLETLLWPAVNALLLMPQRRAPDPDANRPL